MPSRLGITAIILFWLIASSWLIVREIVPLFRAGDPPGFFTDVTDEVGGTRTAWNIFHKGQNVGAAFSIVLPRPDRTFEFTSELHFNKDFHILNSWEIKKIASFYRVGKKGNLKEMTTEVKAGTPFGNIKGEVKGVVRDGMLLPHVYIDDIEADLGIFQPHPIPIPSHGNILNSMHLLNKIPGLWEGRSWKVPLLDPMAIFPGQKMTNPVLLAEVHEDQLEWMKQNVPCFRIDYREPGKKMTARTWVRKNDGLVLQQEANQDEMALVLVREMIK